MAFGDVIRYAPAPPDAWGYGIGGDASTIWYCDWYSQKVYELSVADFSVVRSAASPNTDPEGIGGDAGTIWHCAMIDDKVYELSVADFSVVRSAASPGPYPSGIGGDASKIWHCDSAKVYELSVADFSVVRDVTIPGVWGNGIGGEASKIWYCDLNFAKVYELSVTDFSVVRSAATQKTGPSGIGGDASTIWHCDWDWEEVYELESAYSLPTVTTSPASEVEATAATGNGNITDNGGADCDKRGFVYDTSPHGDPGDTAPADSGYADYAEETDSFGIGAFTGALTSLIPVTTYYVRAYAHNLAGYSYGAEVSFTTLVATPTPTTNPATAVGQTTATLNGILEDDGGEACDCGFEYGETTDYGTETPTQSKTSGQTFSQEVLGLKDGTVYHFRAIATNSAGTSYGADQTFKTPTWLPTVSTDLATDLGAASATLNGTLDDDGGEACDCGFEWGEAVPYGNTTPTESKTTGQTFSQPITGLVPKTTYRFRAFAANSAGTGYGTIRTFTTPARLPIATTNPATGTSTLNGTLDDDGGEACDCGFEWGETDAYGKTTPTQGRRTGQSVLQTIGELLPDTTYHFRAFATNSRGTGYGEDRSFSTPAALPTVATNPATELGAIAAILNGTLNDDGGEVCECGFEFGLDTGYGTITPTEGKITDADFSQVIGGLTPNTVYHFRAFATNSAGTAYGDDETFTTALIISRAFALAREEL